MMSAKQYQLNLLAARKGITTMFRPVIITALVLFHWNLTAILASERLASIQIIEIESGVIVATGSHEHKFGASESTPRLRSLRICTIRAERIAAMGEFSAGEFRLNPLRINWHLQKQTSRLVLIDADIADHDNCATVDFLEGLHRVSRESVGNGRSQQLSCVYKWPQAYGQDSGGNQICDLRGGMKVQISENTQSSDGTRVLRLAFHRDSGEEFAALEIADSGRIHEKMTR